VLPSIYQITTESPAGRVT